MFNSGEKTLKIWFIGHGSWIWQPVHISRLQLSISPFSSCFLFTKRWENTELVIPHICEKLCMQNRGLIIGFEKWKIRNYNPSCFIWIKSNKNTNNLFWKVTDVGLGALAGPHRCFGGISYFYFSAPNHPKATPNQD